MKFLRTVSTRRLLAIIAGFVSAVAAGAAIAVAAQGPGPVPAAKPLPNAIHDALKAPSPSGITARISFTNHLIDATSVQGSDPILSGATGRLWLSSDHRMRLELQSDNGDAQIVVNNGSFWVYEPAGNTVYKGKLPAHSARETKSAARGQQGLASVAQIERDLSRLANHVNLSGAIPGDVAGRATYTVRVSPKHDGGLLGSGELAWDAIKGVPLRVAIYAQHDPTPVLELKATDISYGAVPASTFAISPPSTAKVVTIDTASARSGMMGSAAGSARSHKGHRAISGVSAIARRLPFALVAPAKLVGLPRRDATLLNWGGHPAAVLTYGQNLGGVAVIEQPADSAKAAPLGNNAKGSRHGGAGLSLPTVSINGVTGQELDTALGSVVRFTRGGVTYTVLGSVPAAAADAAARAL